MNQIYLIIENGVVVNAVVWDGESAWAPPQGQTAIPQGDSGAWIGWTYDGANFATPLTTVDD